MRRNEVLVAQFACPSSRSATIKRETAIPEKNPAAGIIIPPR